MEKKNRMIRQGVFLILLSILFVLFAVSSAAITTPWIEVPPSEETNETDETATTELPREKETTTEEASSFEIDQNLTDGSETTTKSGTETPLERSAGTLKKKGCGSTIPQSGVGFAISMIGIIEMVCLIRKEKYDESAN